MQVRMWQCDSHMHRAVFDPFYLFYTYSMFSCPSKFQPVTILTLVERRMGQKEEGGIREGEDVLTTHQDMQREILVIVHLLDH